MQVTLSFAGLVAMRGGWWSSSVYEEPGLMRAKRLMGRKGLALSGCGEVYAWSGWDFVVMLCGGNGF